MGIADANNAGNVHGGVIMYLCDEVAGIAAVRHSGCRVVTVAMDRMTFLHPVYVGHLVTVKATVNAAWRTSMEVGVRVEAENIRSGEITHTSTAYLTMVALDDDGRPTRGPADRARDARRGAPRARGAAAARQPPGRARAHRGRARGLDDRALGRGVAGSELAPLGELAVDDRVAHLHAAAAGAARAGREPERGEHPGALVRAARSGRRGRAASALNRRAAARVAQPVGPALVDDRPGCEEGGGLADSRRASPPSASRGSSRPRASAGPAAGCGRGCGARPSRRSRRAARARPAASAARRISRPRRSSRRRSSPPRPDATARAARRSLSSSPRALASSSSSWRSSDSRAVFTNSHPKQHYGDDAAFDHHDRPGSALVLERRQVPARLAGAVVGVEDGARPEEDVAEQRAGEAHGDDVERASRRCRTTPAGAAGRAGPATS